MKKISPVNNHLLIEPLKHEEFMAAQKETYEEIGTVIEVSSEVAAYLLARDLPMDFLNGKKVYFDSWLAARYPNEDDKDNPFWLVKWEDVRAVDYQK